MTAMMMSEVPMPASQGSGLTETQKKHVQESFALVAPIADAAAALFYDRLFELDPDLKALFDGVDLAAQKKKLLQAMAATVAGLDALEDLVPHLQDLGRRHAGYGVVDAHYETVGQALLWTLHQGLQEQWTSAAEQAWTAAYGVVAGTMKAAAQERVGGPVPPRHAAA